MKKLYTGGTFDLLHFGHFSFLRKCRKIADYLVVSLNTDDFIENYKGQKPIMNYEERKISLEFSGLVDEVIPNVGGDDSKPAILMTKPSIIAIGDDWAKKDYFAQMKFTEEWLEQNDIVLVYLSYTRGISTSEIKKRIKNA